MIKEVISKFIDEHNLTNKTVIVGFSGGYDSMCLLDVMQKLVPEKNIKLIAAHYNHNWRGEIARTEQLRCEEFCEEKNIEFFTQTASIDVKKTETEARKLRYKFFEDAIKQYCADVVFTAHNYNDNAETVIMNLLRGSAISGLKGIEPKREEKYIRPLIDCERSQIEKYCEENNLNPRIDESNFENEYTRNKIRNICIPYIKKEFNPNIINTIKRLSETVSEEENYMQEQTIKAYNNLIISESKEEIELNLKEFIKQEKVIKRRLVLYTITKLQGNCLGIQKVNIEDIVDMCDKNIGNKYIMPNKNIKVMLKSKNLFFSINNLEI